jgi:hypothetical protein
VKDVRKVVVPEWGPLENEPEIQDYGHSLIEMIMAKGSNRLKGAINVSGKHVLELKAMSDKASKSWRWVAYRNDPFKRKSINALLKKILMVLC